MMVLGSSEHIVSTESTNLAIESGKYYTVDLHHMWAFWFRSGNGQEWGLESTHPTGTHGDALRTGVLHNRDHLIHSRRSVHLCDRIARRESIPIEGVVNLS
jgi:hypothetical protein